MKRILFPVAIAASLMLSSYTFLNSANWKVANGYSITFTSKNPEGVFTSLKGDVVFDANDLASSKFDMVVDVASINTGSGMKNKHAKSKKWFDAQTYPTIKFTSNKIEQTPAGYSTTGILDMHGVQKEITIPFTFENNTFKGSIKVNRLDYKIGTTKGMSAKAATELAIDIAVPVTQ